MRSVATAIIVVLASASSCRAEEPLPLPYKEGLIARVNNEAILRSEVEKKIEDRVVGLRNTWPNPKDFAQALQEEFDKALVSLVKERVIEMEAKRLTISVTEQEIDQEMAEEIRKEAGGDREKYKGLIAQMGFSMKTRREFVRLQILAGDVLGGAIDRGAIFVVPEKVSRYYADHPADFLKPERVKSLVLKIEALGPRETERALREAEGLKKQVEAGANFADLVKWRAASDGKEVSLTPQLLARTAFDSALQGVLFESPLNTVIGPIHGEKCVYLAVVLEREAGESVTFDEAQASIAAMLRHQAYIREVDAAEERLLDKAVVKFEPQHIQQWFEHRHERGPVR